MTASEVAPAGGGMPSIFASLPGIFQLVALFMFVGWLRQWRKERWAKEAKAEAEAQAVARRRGLVGDITLEILATFNGTDPAKQILLAVKGIVFDVTKGHKHYGPGVQGARPTDAGMSNDKGRASSNHVDEAAEDS